jgi:hypothetical protein
MCPAWLYTDLLGPGGWGRRDHGGGRVITLDQPPQGDLALVPEKYIRKDTCFRTCIMAVTSSTARTTGPQLSLGLHMLCDDCPPWGRCSAQRFQGHVRASHVTFVDVLAGIQRPTLQYTSQQVWLLLAGFSL